MPFWIKAMGQQLAEAAIKNHHFEGFPIPQSARQLSFTHLCAEENLGLCYDLEEFQSISHSLCVKISIWRLSFQLQQKLLQ